MNIAIFIKKTTFHADYGGLETQNLFLSEGLVKRGYEVTVFSPKLDLQKDSEDQNGVSYKFVECSFRSLGGFGHLAKDNWTNRSVEDFKKEHEKEKFDLVLGQSSAALGVIKVKNELDVPVISISHGSAVGEFKTLAQNAKNIKNFIYLLKNIPYFLFNFFKRQREFILHSDGVIAVSNVVKQALIEETYVRDNRVHVAHNGISSYSPEKNPPDSPTQKVSALYVGLIHRSKGLGDLVKALESEELSELCLDIVGGGDYLEELRDLVSKKGLSDRVNLPGKVHHDEVVELMTKSDIFVLPSRRMEGFPMTLVEAMFAKLPIIGARIGGIPEAIDHDETGIIYESGDIKGLQEALLKLLKSSELRKSMGEKGYQRAQREFTLDAMLTKYEKIIADCI